MCLIFFYPNLTAEARALLTLLRGLCIITRVPCFPNLLLVKFGKSFFPKIQFIYYRFPILRNLVFHFAVGPIFKNSI